MNKPFSDLIYLCSCAVNRIKPDSCRVTSMDIGNLYKAAGFHTLTSVTASALEAAGVRNHDFSQAGEKALRKIIFHDTERKKLFDFLEEKGIWYMPLKGVVLKDMYPKPGMRQMADNDILFDPEYRETVREYFVSHNYKIISYGHDIHDEYEKPPVLHFEMHPQLIGKDQPEEWQEYFRNIKERLVRDDDSQYGYHFTDEDFYIYFTVHEYKHYSGSGTGLRSLLDCYVYLSAKKDTLDWDYIESACEKLGTAEFEKQSRELAYALFEKGDLQLSGTENEMLERFLSSGTYGTPENNAVFKMKRYEEKTGSSSKIRYLLYRLFPDSSHYQLYAPFVWKYKILVPFYLVFRLVRGLTVRRRRLFGELKTVRKVRLNEK